MENMIEKLKNNLCQWQCMPKEEKEYMKSLPLGAVGIVGKRGSLFIFPVKPWFDSKEDIYRIVPDYEPEIQSADAIHADLVRLLAEERAKKKEPEIVRCEVVEINGNLFFIENSGPVRLYKALSRANYIRCEDEEGKPCSLREYKKQRLNQPAKWPKWVIFKNKVSK